MMLSKEEYLNLVDVLADEDKFDEYVWNFVYQGDDLSPANVEYAKDYIMRKLKELIVEHFDNKFLDDEVELLISLLRRVEDELGMDITLLIDKLRRIQNTLPKEEGVVTCVEFEID